MNRNYYRLAVLVVNIAPDVLRKKVTEGFRTDFSKDWKEGGDSGKDMIKRYVTNAKLLTLNHAERQVLESSQMRDFDITLCCSLLWAMRTLERVEFSAVTELRKVRNEYAHCSKMSNMDDAKFKQLWLRASRALSTLDQRLQKELDALYDYTEKENREKVSTLRPRPSSLLCL